MRWERHSAFSAGGSDPAEQRRAWQRVDPIPRFRNALVAWGVATNDGARRAPTQALEPRCARSATAAEQAPLPAPESIYEDIFAP